MSKKDKRECPCTSTYIDRNLRTRVRARNFNQDPTKHTLAPVVRSLLKQARHCIHNVTASIDPAIRCFNLRPLYIIESTLFLCLRYYIFLRKCIRLSSSCVNFTEWNIEKWTDKLAHTQSPNLTLLNQTLYY
ncbi:uncharacterized protein LOC122535625 [Frieseomelitta varia]|uniref:uncharacterized protein LOC122535625 n=1 Tax=Frieseomelitta varia TaxID=561572 RepID=UPI001CB6A15C|nr:uncharacterized protein LOC122535625 [Frieseomelitta varia]